MLKRVWQIFLVVASVTGWTAVGCEDDEGGSGAAGSDAGGSGDSGATGDAVMGDTAGDPGPSTGGICDDSPFPQCWVDFWTPCWDPEGACTVTPGLTTVVSWANGAMFEAEVDIANPNAAMTTYTGSSGTGCATGTVAVDSATGTSTSDFVSNGDTAQLVARSDGSLTITCPDGTTHDISTDGAQQAGECNPTDTSACTM